jgi:hypothetical protein
MKKTIAIFFSFFFLLFLSSNSFAQVTFGARAGINISSMRVGVLGLNITTQSKIGLNIDSNIKVTEFNSVTSSISATDTEVTKIDDEGETDEKGGDTQELDVTELVKTQEKIEQKQEEYFNNLFGYIQNLETKLGEMGQVIDRLNAIETKIEKYREKTPQEKLQLRSLDSGPFTQKLTDFFDDKKEDFEKAGKHEYVLTSDEVEDVNPSEIKSTFRAGEEEDKFKF